MRQSRDKHDDPPRGRHRAPPGGVPTIGDLMRGRMGNWLWFWCCNPACGHYRAVALSPIAIMTGLDMPFDQVQARARCEVCGSLGAQTTGPSWGGKDVGWAAFPAARPAGSLTR